MNSRMNFEPVEQPEETPEFEKPAIFNGTYTIQGPKGHRTFRIKTQKDDATFAPGSRVIALLVGSDNTSDYKGFGFVKGDQIFVWKSKRGTGDWETYAKLLRKLALGEEVPGYTLHLAGTCVRCNRKLTVPWSIENGIGPICASK